MQQAVLKNDCECQKGGFSPCEFCGQYEGTLIYQQRYESIVLYDFIYFCC
jgi:hypothetical protein